MPHLMLKDLPRFECLLEASREFPDLDPSATEVFLHLLRAGDEAYRVVESHLAGHEITDGRFGVMMALWGRCRQTGSSASLTPAEIAEHTGVTRATITGLVDSLERAGLVTRTPHVQDRRMTAIALTPRGQQLLIHLLPEHFRQMAWLMSPLKESERKTFVRLLSKVLRRAGEHELQPVGRSSSAARAAR